jgi:hypothetical protein
MQFPPSLLVVRIGSMPETRGSVVGKAVTAATDRAMRQHIGACLFKLQPLVGSTSDITLFLSCYPLASMVGAWLEDEPIAVHWSFGGLLGLLCNPPCTFWPERKNGTRKVLNNISSVLGMTTRIVSFIMII